MSERNSGRVRLSNGPDWQDSWADIRPTGELDLYVDRLRGAFEQVHLVLPNAARRELLALLLADARQREEGEGGVRG